MIFWHSCVYTRLCIKHVYQSKQRLCPWSDHINSMADCTIDGYRERGTSGFPAEGILTCTWIQSLWDFHRQGRHNTKVIYLLNAFWEIVIGTSVFPASIYLVWDLFLKIGCIFIETCLLFISILSSHIGDNDYSSERAHVSMVGGEFTDCIRCVLYSSTVVHFECQCPNFKADLFGLLPVLMRRPWPRLRHLLGVCPRQLHRTDRSMDCLQLLNHVSHSEGRGGKSQSLKQYGKIWRARRRHGCRGNRNAIQKDVC